jgi:hypothetical protein
MGFLSFFNINKTKQNLIDYVYVCRDGDNEELRYSIRSVIENGPAGNIWVIGGKPDWYTGNFIFVENNRNKYTHVRNSLNAVINSELIKDDFILMNDDFFIIKPLEAIPVLNGGTLREKISRHNRGSGSYGAMLHQVFSHLRKILPTIDPMDYELHVPMEMNKQKLAKVVKKPYLWRSLYGNMFQIGGEQMRDVKVYHKDSIEDALAVIERSPYISTNEASFDKIIGDKIKEMFPNPSKYEHP